MNIVKFKSICIRNFLSIGDEPVYVEFKPGLNIITGNNRDKEDRRNGVGKSSIADAVNFAVFGNTIRDIKRENVNNDCTGKRCEVVLSFDVETEGSVKKYTISRFLNPSKISIMIDGVDKTLDTIDNNNAFITKILNTNQEVFDNCVIMTVNSTLPFMGKKKQDKRKFIESIFNLEIFGKMLCDVKSQYSDQKREFDISSGKKVEIDNNLSAFQLQYNNFDKKKNDRINDLKSRVAALSRDLKDQDANLKKITNIDFEIKRQEIQNKKNTLLNEAALIVNDINKLKQQISGLDGEAAALSKTISKVNGDYNKCPTCLRDVTDVDKKHIELEVNKIKDEIKNLNSKKIELNKQISTQDTYHKDRKDGIDAEDQKLAKLAAVEKQQVTIQNQIDRLKNQINDLTSTITIVNDENNTFAVLIEEQKKRQAVIIAEIEESKNALEILNNVKFVFSEEGVKSFLIKKIIDILNNRLAFYLKKLDANCTCVFNEYFEETIINDKGKISSYFNFSGAERKSIDLACLFTFMDVRRLQGDTVFNFSLYDELLDSSLDEKGIELVLDILHERIEKYGECMFVISHRKESVKFATGEIIMLEKYNGTTKRVDFTII